MKTTATILGTLILLGMVIVIGLKGCLWYPARTMERTARSLLGRTEAELVAALGEPRHVVTAATLGGKSVDHPWQGMNFVPVPDRPVRGRVLLYSWMNVAIYVYVDERGKIEHVATAGT